MRPAPAPPTEIEHIQLDKFLFYLHLRIGQLNDEIDLYTPWLSRDQPRRTPEVTVNARRRVDECVAELSSLYATLDTLDETYAHPGH